MKFKITSTQNKWFSTSNNAEHAKMMYLSYPEIKNKAKIINNKGELEIEISSIEELVKLADFDINGIIIYKDTHYDDGKFVKDDKYTIEIYDDYRE